MAVGKVRTGVILISIGVLLLLNTTGVVDFGFWRWLGRLWPVILIAIGIEKMFSSSSSSNLRNLAWLSPALIVGVVAYSVVASERSPRSDSWSDDVNWQWDWDRDGGDAMSNSTWSEAFTSTASGLRLSLDMSGGRLVVRGGSDSGNILEARTSNRGDKPKVESNITDGIQTIEVVQRDRPDHHERDQWIMKLTDSLPVELTINGGAARMRLDLSAVKAEILDLEAGAADIDIVFGSLASRVTCTVECGAAAVDITIPETAGLRIERESVLSGFSHANLDLIERGGYEETEGYDAAPVKIDLKFNSAVSSLRLRRAGSAAAGESI